ncbi:7-carboxy-7-deazaguanine synthase QueE [Candidatus Omnitrophota bacterium]
MKARIAEVFQSIQGEGIHLGKEQVFIRFFGCNLERCAFCDTRLSAFKEYAPADLCDYLKSGFSRLNSVALTGGEPLVQKEFLSRFLPLLKQAGLEIYLETNATLPGALRAVIDYIDIIAIDFKFPSSTGLRRFWQEHEEFLKLATQKEVLIKAVICHSTVYSDLEQAVKVISRVNRAVPFILQPNSFESGSSLTNKILEFKRFSLQSLSDVRIVPQLHKMIGVR